MSKCGKGCMPECEYFTTGGCISPFNCPYKIETGYINSATSIPTHMEQYNGMSDDNIKCLQAENAELHERLKEAEHRAEVEERAFDSTMNVFHEIVSAMFPDKKIDLDKWKKDNLANAEKKIAEEGE